MVVDAVALGRGMGVPVAGPAGNLPEAWLIAEHLFFLFKLESMAGKEVMRAGPGEPGGARASGAGCPQ